MIISSYSYAITTTGSAGSATGSATTETLIGQLVDVFFDYHASAPNTTDITIAFAGQGGNILAAANANTDALLAPRQKYVDNAAAAITDSNGPFILNSPLTISVAGSDALAPAVTVTLRVMR